MNGGIKLTVNGGFKLTADWPMGDLAAYRYCGVLAVEGRDCSGRFLGVGVLLEVHEAAGKEEHVTSFQIGREKCV